MRAFLNEADVVLHILGGPAAAVGHKQELREGEAQFAEEGQHLTGYTLHVILAAGDDE